MLNLHVQALVEAATFQCSIWKLIFFILKPLSSVDKGYVKLDVLHKVQAPFHERIHSDVEPQVKENRKRVMPKGQYNKSSQIAPKGQKKKYVF